jgi:putative flippase GtrA
MSLTSTIPRASRVIPKIRKLLQRPIVRYLLVGGSVYIFELAVIVVFQHNGANAVTAVAWSFILGTLVSFALQKIVTFGDKRMHHKILLPQLLATCALVLFNFGFTITVTYLLASIVPAVVSRTVALLTTTIWNFYLYRTRIFKKTAEI